MKVALIAPLLAACWSSNTKDLERKVDQLSVELANSRAEIEQLQRKVAALSKGSPARDQPASLEAKIDELQRKMETTQALIRQGPTAPAYRPNRAQHDPQKTYSIAVGKAAVDGPADAKVTMVVAGEYACPYCEKVRPTLVDLRKKYGKDLRLAFKQFIVHPTTATAPALAICAATKQKKHDKLDALLWDKGFKTRTFDVQTQLPDGSSQNCWEHVDGCPVVLGFAREAGLDLARFKADMAGPCVAENADTMRELQALGVGATPSFFINGRFMSGAMPLENFAAVIDEEIKKADERIKKGTKRARYYQEWVVDKGEKTLAPTTTP